MSNSLLNDQKINKLINEIKSRPPLYNKKLKEYLDNNLKKKLWLQIYRAVWKDWDSKTGEQKLEDGKEIQDKWNGLRSCFSRELREQKNRKGRPKRRKYIFFDRLSFLLPHTKPRCMVSNHPEREADQENETSEEHAEPAQLTREPGRESITPNIIPDRSAWTEITRAGENVPENNLVEILSQKQQTGIDEDVTFALSLVPFLKRVSDDKKIDARIEILQVLRHFTNTQLGQHQSMGSTIQRVQDQCSQGSYQINLDPYRFSAEIQPMEADVYSEHSSHSDILDIKTVVNE